jgi:hypothetical protein
MSDKLNEFLSKEPQVRTRCSICANDEIAEVVESHLKKLRVGSTAVTMKRVYDGLIFPQWEHPKSFDTIRAHVKKCMRRNIRTGEEL